MKNLFKSYIYIWVNAKSYIFISFVLKIIVGLIPITSLFITTNLVDELTKIVQNENTDFFLIYTLLILQIMVMLIPQILSILDNYMNLKVGIRMDYITQLEIFNKVQSLALH